MQKQEEEQIDSFHYINLDVRNKCSELINN